MNLKEKLKPALDVLTILIFSAVPTCIVSSIFAGGITLLGFGNFWGWFYLVTAIQAILGWLVNVVSSKVLGVRMLEAQAQALLANAYQNAELNCSYCNVRNTTRLAIGKENSFKCAACNSVNAVHIQFTTARSTEPLTSDKVLKDIFDKIADEPIDTTTKQNAINTSKIEVDKSTKQES